jgi:aspartate aminotransferase
VSYPAQVTAVGATAVVVATREEDGFRLTPEALQGALSDRTRAVILNTPCNPTGAVYSADELRALAEVLAGTEALVIFDEIYSKLVFGERTHANLVAVAPHLRDRAVIVNGASKAFAMTGWRIGLAAGPEELIAVMGRFQSQTTSNATTVSQYACLEALNGPEGPVTAMVQAFEKRGRRLHELLAGVPDITCAKPDGAFYLFPNVSSCFGKELGGQRISNSLELSKAILEEAKVATVAGSAFGAEGYLRLSYVVDVPVLEEAVQRIRDLLASAG